MSNFIIEMKMAVIKAACGICSFSEEKLLKHLEAFYIKAFTAGLNQKITDTTLYHKVNAMMAVMGADGQVCTKQQCVLEVMDALHNVDDGDYRPPPADQPEHHVTIDIGDDPVAGLAKGGIVFTALTDAGQALPRGRYNLYARPVNDAADQARRDAVDVDALPIEQLVNDAANKVLGTTSQQRVVGTQLEIYTEFARRVLDTAQAASAEVQSDA